MAIIPNVFTDKAVGVAFAAAFALWAWMLNNLASTVMEGVREIRADQAAIKTQIADIRSEVLRYQITDTTEVATIRARQQDVLRRLDALEDGHEQRSR